MKRGDLVFYYHSGQEKSVVGVARVTRESYPDPTATDGDWSAIDLAPHRSLSNPVTLAQIKADAILQRMALVRQSRLSVSPVTAEQAARLLVLAQTKL
jgi:predicted RNA-binding protein with PUA-like domain